MIDDYTFCCFSVNLWDGLEPDAACVQREHGVGTTETKFEIKSKLEII